MAANAFAKLFAFMLSEYRTSRENGVTEMVRRLNSR